MNLVKTFTLRFNPEHMQFDDTVLGAFMREHLVVSMKTEFFYFREEPLWSVMVTYRDQHQPSSLVAGVQQDLREASVKKEGRQMLPKPKIDEHQRAVYEKLRLWRNEIARAKGHPPGNLFTNRQLHEIVELNPKSIKQLTKVHGIGTYKATTYGLEILKFLSVLGQVADPLASNREKGRSQSEERLSQAGEKIRTPVSKQGQGAANSSQVSEENSQVSGESLQTSENAQQTSEQTVQVREKKPQASEDTVVSNQATAGDEEHG